MPESAHHCSVLHSNAVKLQDMPNPSPACAVHGMQDMHQVQDTHQCWGLLLVHEHLYVHVDVNVHEHLMLMLV
jgi:hypothetical protein